MDCVCEYIGILSVSDQNFTLANNGLSEVYINGMTHRFITLRF